MRGGSNVAWKDSWHRFVSFWEGAAAAGPPDWGVNGITAGDPGRVDGDVAANTPVLHTYTFEGGREGGGRARVRPRGREVGGGTGARARGWEGVSYGAYAKRVSKLDRFR